MDNQSSQINLEKGKLMKHIKKRWLGLAFAPALLALIGFASPVNAANYSGDCAGISSFNGSGNVDITNTGTCSLPTALTATGFIHINSTGAITAQSLQGTDLDIKTTGGAITTQALTSTNGDLKVSAATSITTTGAVSSRYAIQANANSGTIAISGNLASNQSGAGGNVLLVATGNISTGSISTNSGGGTAGVEIHANTNAAGGTFTIGASSANGVNTTIDTSNTTTGGQDPNFVLGGVYITNGNVGSTTAQIKVTNASNINVAASASRSGLIYLDARKGTISLPTGALSSTGPAGQPAGQIVLMAGTLKTVNNTVITASQTAAAISTNHGVIIAASNITVAGAGGLKINGDGNGITGSAQTAYAMVVPTGGITVSSTAFTSNNVNSMLWTPSTINTADTNGPVAVSGAGAFTLTANGNNAKAAVYAYPMTFSNAAVNISSKGTSNHRVELVYAGTLSGSNGLTLSGNGAVTLDASGSAGNDSGGIIYVLVDQATIASTVPSLTIKADAKGTGTGGNVTFQPTKVISLAAPTVNMTANNGKTTSGAGVVNFQPNGGNGTADISSTTFNLRADGPTAGNGDAGVIYFATSGLTLSSTTKSVFSAKGATAGTGKGGFITVFPGAIADYKLGTNPGNLQVLADGGLNGGDAGRINVNPFPGSITIDTADAVSAKAQGGNAKGGFIQLVGNPNLTVNPAANGSTINVDGKGTGNAGEIHIFAQGTLALGNTAGSLSLSAQGDPTGTGDGGIIEIAYTTNLTTSGTLSVSAGKGASSNGKGGIINIRNAGSITVGSTTFEAIGQGTGKGGDITLNNTFIGSPIDLSQATVTAKAGASGTGGAGGTGIGGNVTVTQAAGASGNALFVNTRITVDGSPTLGANDSMGVISLNGITCKQWKTAAGTVGTNLPRYWNCANLVPTANEAVVPGAVAGLPASFLSTMSSASLYIFANSAAYNSYFATAGSAYTIPAGILGNTPTGTNLNIAAVFESTGSGVDYTPYLRGNLMHEIGHRIDYNSVVQPSGTVAFNTAANNTQAALTGTWPTGGNVPTCLDVFNSPGMCSGFPNTNPWDIYFTRFMGSQTRNPELFSKGFQNCSGFLTLDVQDNTALQSVYMKGDAANPRLYYYMNTTFWPGGCPRIEP